MEIPCPLSILPLQDLLASLMILCLVQSGLSSRLVARPQDSFDVVRYGATGNGRTDDSKAFLNAWQAICEADVVTATLMIPDSKTFLLNPVSFNGPCRAPKLHVAIKGTLIAPIMNRWNGDNIKWIGFYNMNGSLIVDGGGVINGRGKAWWDSANIHGPPILDFHNCNGLWLRHLTLLNGPNQHINVNGIRNGKISNLNIIAPRNSPNTDGIKVSSVNHFQIKDSSIKVGDDCIALLSDCSFVNITNVACGPGHGISVGSLGGPGTYSTVEEVHVENCTFTGTMNGVRIKTKQGGTGYVRNVRFEQLQFQSIMYPLVINQNYGDFPTHDKNIKVSGISFIAIEGTTKRAAITFNCSQSVPCTNIYMERVDIRSAYPGKKTFTTCSNAQGRSKQTSPRVPCLS